MIDRERRAWLRFFIVIAAAALGETIGIWQRLPFSDLLLPLLFGGAAFYLTMGMTAPRLRSNGNVRYWRGRKLDDD
ncbi:MAG TPA: hypothetical protein VIN70_05695 [Candidatus Limnocylindria bacterium]